MNPNEIVVHEVNCQRSNVMLNAFAEPIRETGKPTHVHSHIQVLPLNVGCGNQINIRVPEFRLLLNPGANVRRVARFRACRRAFAVLLDEHGIINSIRAKRFTNGGKIDRVSIGGELNAIGETACNVAHENVSGLPVPASNMPRNDKLRIGIEGGPCPNRTGFEFGFLFHRSIRVFLANVAPNFIALNALRLHIHYALIMVAFTRFAELQNDFRDRIAGRSGNTRRGANAVPLNEAANDFDLLFAVQFIYRYLNVPAHAEVSV
jgi:hypothetical protein